MTSYQTRPVAEPAGKTVLVVEDDVALRLVISLTLREDAGLTVIEARNADEALDLLRMPAPVDVVFTDVRMLGALDGIALARHVLEAYPQIKVAIASGNLTQQERIPGIRHFTKPYDLDEVRTHIIALIDAQLPDQA